MDTARDRAIANAHVVSHTTPWDVVRDLVRMLDHVTSQMAEAELAEKTGSISLHPVTSCVECNEVRLAVRVYVEALRSWDGAHPR